MKILNRQIVGLFLIILLAGCQTVKMTPRPRTELSVQGVPFRMIHLQAADFPGGDLGIVELHEPRPDIVGVKEDYWLAETNTTYELWNTVYTWAIENGYTFHKIGQMGSEKDGAGMTDQHPVTVVDWSSAAVWCNALTELYNLENGKKLKPVYEHQGETLKNPIQRINSATILARPGADGFRLPTGLEWELAARYSDSKKDASYVEYPPKSGRYWVPFLVVSGELEHAEATGGKVENVEFGSITSKPVKDLERNDLGFTGFAGKDGKLWQWCYEFIKYNGRDSYHLKRGGSRGPRCGRHGYWPGTFYNPVCNGYDQITFRVARTAAGGEYSMKFPQ